MARIINIRVAAGVTPGRPPPCFRSSEVDVRSPVIVGALLVTIAAGIVIHRAGTAKPAAQAVTVATAAPLQRNVLTTGTLEAVTTVQVGTEVSGVIKSLPVDF